MVAKVLGLQTVTVNQSSTITLTSWYSNPTVCFATAMTNTVYTLVGALQMLQ
jgi:hypothetical protein